MYFLIGELYREKAMKKVIMTLLVVVAATTLTTKLSAQYSIPSFNVPVIADPTTFEEAQSSNTSYNINLLLFNPFSQKPVNREERDIIIKVKDNDSGTTAYATVEIYSLDYTYLYGPYTVYEGTNFEMPLSSEYQWGLRTIAASTGCEMDVWFE